VQSQKKTRSTNLQIYFILSHTCFQTFVRDVNYSNETLHISPFQTIISCTLGEKAQKSMTWKKCCFDWRYDRKKISDVFGGHKVYQLNSWTDYMVQISDKNGSRACLQSFLSLVLESFDHSIQLVTPDKKRHSTSIYQFQLKWKNISYATASTFLFLVISSSACFL
jgi:hypothetical protein